jgi:hypothetical protein
MPVMDIDTDNAANSDEEQTTDERPERHVLNERNIESAVGRKTNTYEPRGGLLS